MDSYEVLAPIRKTDGELITEGVIELEGEDEKLFLERGFVRTLPSRGSSERSSEGASGETGTANRQNSGGSGSTADSDVDSEMVRTFGEDLAGDLVRGGYKSVDQVRGAGEEELLAVGGIGKKSVKKIRAASEGNRPGSSSSGASGGQ